MYMYRKFFGGHSVTTRLCLVGSRARARRRRVCCALAQLFRCNIFFKLLQYVRAHVRSRLEHHIHDNILSYDSYDVNKMT